MKYLVLVLLSLKIFAQTPNVWISGHFPQNDHVLDSTVTLYVQYEDDRRIAIDANGDFKIQFTLQKPSYVYLTNLPMQHILLLKPGDSIFVNVPQSYTAIQDRLKGTSMLLFTDKFTKLSGKGAALNDFLKNNMLLYYDSVVHSPLFKKMAENAYFDIIDGISRNAWYHYESTQDTSNHDQNTLVWASVKGQNYLRKRAFLSQEKLDVSNLKLTILPQDDASRSWVYTDALISYLGIDEYEMNENWAKRIEKLQEQFRTMPQTLEFLWGRELNTMLSHLYNSKKRAYDVPILEANISDYKRQFPQSKYLKRIDHAFFVANASCPMEPGKVFPDLKFLKQDKKEIMLRDFVGKPTVLFFYNTWCDSCKVELDDFLRIAQLQSKQAINWVAICINSRQSSWENFIAKTSSEQVQHLFSNRDDLYILTAMFDLKNNPSEVFVYLLDAQSKGLPMPLEIDLEAIEQYLSK